MKGTTSDIRQGWALVTQLGRSGYMQSLITLYREDNSRYENDYHLKVENHADGDALRVRSVLRYEQGESQSSQL